MCIYYLCRARGKINRPGQLAPTPPTPGEDNQVQGQDVTGQLAPRGSSQLGHWSHVPHCWNSHVAVPLNTTVMISN